MKIFVIGDIHLRDKKEGLDWGYNHLGLYNFFNSLEVSKEDIVVFCGDVFDKSIHSGTTNLAALQAFSLLSSSVKSIYIVTGNHEVSKIKDSNLNSINIFPNLFIIHSINYDKVINDNKILLFLPHIIGTSLNGKYEEEVNIFCEKESLKSVDYIFGHHFFRENSIMDNPYLDLDKLDVEWNYCFFGHNHKFEKISNKTTCVGSICPDNKGERTYSPYYVIIDEDNKIKYVPISDNFFIQFKEINWGDNIDIKSKDFIIVKCKCKKEDKYLIEQDIRSKYKNNLYEIMWDIEEEEKKDSIVVSSNEDLVNKFFEENTYSKDVKDLFNVYNSREV